MQLLFALLIEPWTRSRAPTLLACLRLLLHVQLALWLTLRPLHTMHAQNSASSAPVSSVVGCGAR